MKKGDGKYKTFCLDFFFNKLFSWLSFLERGVKMAFLMKKTPEIPEVVIRCLTDICPFFHIQGFSSN